VSRWGDRPLIGWGRRRRERAAGAPMPRDVRLLREDGRELPVELLYHGTDDDGIHCWIAAVPAYQVHPGERLGIRCASLPARTSVTIGIRPSPDEPLPEL
jgi:hypothetical protein